MNDEKLIRQLYDTLCNKLQGEYTIERDKVFDICLYGIIHVDITVSKDNEPILYVRQLRLTEYDLNNTLAGCLQDYEALQPIYYVIVHNGKLYLWKGFHAKKPKAEGFAAIAADTGREEFLFGKLEDNRVITEDKLVNYVLSYDKESYCKINKQQLNSFLLKNCPYDLQDKVKTFLAKLPKDMDCTDGNTLRFWFEKDWEKEFFRCLLPIEKTTQVYRYVPYSTLSYILKDGTLSMSSIISMNDISEGKYANAYMQKRLGGKINSHQIWLKDFENEIVDTYISSFSTQDDDLMMWNMYADGGKGVELIFDVNFKDNDDFMLLKVSYAQTGIEKDVDSVLDYVCQLLEDSLEERRFYLCFWYIWQHFFKQRHYKNENEVRLLYIRENIANENPIERQWVKSSNGIFFPIIKFNIEGNKEDGKEVKKTDFVYPLKLKGVKLGPLFPEKCLNKKTLELYLREHFGSGIDVSCSEIESYRG